MQLDHGQPDDIEISSPAGAKLGRYQSWAIAVWATILIVLCTRGLLRPGSNSVYPIFANAARHFLAGTDLYEKTDGPYRYSPLVAGLLVPFSLCSDSLGSLLWRLLNAAVYLGSLAWWCRAVPQPALTANQRAIIYLLIVPLSVGSLNNAQSNALILGLLLAGTAAVTRQFWNLASGCVALACLFKLYPIAVGLLLTALFPRRFAGRFLIALLIGLGLPFLFKPSVYVLQQYMGWWHHLLADDRQNLPVELWYRDFRLVCWSCQQMLSPMAYLAIQLLAAALMAGLCAWAKLVHLDRRRLLALLLGLGCCWMTLFGPATESCTYILLAPVLAWTLVSAWLQPGHAWLRSILVLSLALFTVSRIAVWFPGGARQMQIACLQPWAALLLLVGVVGRELQVGRAGQTAEMNVDRLRSAQAA
ncbi:MAG TPA: glycosyltransferase 87 family protein [Gemmataceae bacterium]|nr:glycosyltransferase 87 family protein [Gemmataceae bacterium]